MSHKVIRRYFFFTLHESMDISFSFSSTAKGQKYAWLVSKFCTFFIILGILKHHLIVMLDSYIVEWR